MTQSIPRIFLLLLVVLPIAVSAKGKKAPKVAITFHLESNPIPGKKMTFKWPTSLGEKHFRRSSEFNTKEIIAQRPFPSPHVKTEYGMVFKFNKDATRRLESMTRNNPGKHLIIFVNGTPMDMVYIDRPVTDGMVCIWRGLLASHVHLADSLAPRIGEDAKKWKKRLKEEAKKKKT